MKNLLFLLVCFVFFNAKSQELPVIDGKITYTEVVNLGDSIKKDELFNRSKICFVNIFKNSNRVIQNEDKEAGNITGKGAVKIYIKTIGGLADAGYVNYTLSISVKDGKYKYSISNFIHDTGVNLENGKPKGWTNKVWSSILNKVDEESKGLAASIKREMGKSKKDNW